MPESYDTVDGRALIDSITTEAEFQKQVIELAESCGWLVAHFHDSRKQAGDKLVGDKQAAGFPDLVLARNGYVRFVELKAEGKYLTWTQKVWRDALNTDTPFRVYAWYLWRPSDWDAITDILT